MCSPFSMKAFSSYTHQINNLILQSEADTANVHNYDACQVMHAV